MVVEERRIELSCKRRRTDVPTGGEEPIHAPPDGTEPTTPRVALTLEGLRNTSNTVDGAGMTARKCGRRKVDSPGTVSST